jgi:Rha family phage regulatory protein
MSELTVIKSVKGQATEIMSRINIFERDGESWTDSLSVSGVFGKRHDNILEVTRKIDKENQVVGLLTFKESSYINSQGKAQPFYEMTETGFFSLVARFNDQKDKDISLIRSCYFKEFDRLKKEKRTVITGNDILIGLSIKLTNMLEELKDQNIQNKIEHHEIKHEVIQFNGRIHTVEKKVDTACDKINSFESKLIELTEKRRNVSKKDERLHIIFTFQKYNGICPLCRESMVLDTHQKRINDSEIDHFFDKKKNRLDQTWLICRDCNSQMNVAKKDRTGIAYRDAQTMFNAYQIGITQWQKKRDSQKAFDFS